MGDLGSFSAAQRHSLSEEIHFLIPVEGFNEISLKKKKKLKMQKRCDVLGRERWERRRLDTLTWTRRWNAANKRANDTVKHSKRAIPNAREKNGI